MVSSVVVECIMKRLQYYYKTFLFNEYTMLGTIIYIQQIQVQKKNILITDNYRYLFMKDFPCEE
jgi:hypothetical protein